MSEARSAASRLRAAAPADLRGVQSLLDAAGLPTAGLPPALAGFIVAEADGRLVGVAGLEIYGEYGLLRSVATDASCRGHGLGRRLTERIVAHGRELGLRRIFLLTTTAEDYFPRHGFRRIDRSGVAHAVQQSVEFREACPATATAMALDLGAWPAT